jgi:DMSO/TMAO reductase YedYZ heme-binding membrane subunit
MNHLFWYTARAGGIVAWALTAASVVWGLWLSGRVRPFGVRPAWILDLHRFLGALATIFVGVHVAAILADSYTNFGLSDVLVPLASKWHPLAVAWGVVGLYVMLAVELTSLARKHLPHQLWRRIHVMALPLYIFATIHFVAAGTDAANPISLVAIAVATSSVVMLFVRRVQEMRERDARQSNRTARPAEWPAVAPAPVATAATDPFRPTRPRRIPQRQ